MAGPTGGKSEDQPAPDGLPIRAFARSIILAAAMVCPAALGQEAMGSSALPRSVRGIERGIAPAPWRLGASSLTSRTRADLPSVGQRL
jgi:hypothetical protein